MHSVMLQCSKAVWDKPVATFITNILYSLQLALPVRSRGVHKRWLKPCYLSVANGIALC